MVSRWKVLLAALVIFAAGSATGAMIVRTYAPRIVTHVTPPVSMSTEHRMDFVRKMDRELQLTPEQRQKVEAIVMASQQRMKTIWDVVEPQVREEYRASRHDIFEVLNPEQREKMKSWRHNGSRTNWTNWTNRSRLSTRDTNSPASNDARTNSAPQP